MSQRATALQNDARLDTDLNITPTVAADGGPWTVRSFGMTHPGRVRPNNEDQYLIAMLTKALQVLGTSIPQSRLQYGSERGYLFVVADGMGGHQGGQQASTL